MKQFIFSIILFCFTIAPTQAQSEISDTKFTDLVTNPDSRTYVVEFYADWCPICKIMKPKLDQLAKEYTDLTFYRINMEETKVDELIGIFEIPYYMILKEGEVVDVVVGAFEEELASAVSDSSRKSKVKN